MSVADVSVMVERNVESVMRDGTVLRADLYRPPDHGDPLPVLLNRTPYDKTHPRYLWIAEEMVAAGYIAVIQDTRGRYTSDGDWKWHLTPEGHQQEAEDGYDTCEWAARLPGADGQIGTWGNSYPSGTAWWMAGAQPPSLKAVFTSGFPPSHRTSTYAIFEIGQRLAWQHRMAVSSRKKAGDESWPQTVAEAVRNWDLERGKWLWHLPIDTIPDRLWGPTAGPFHDYLADIAAEHWEGGFRHENIAVPTCSLTGWWDRLSECSEHFTLMREKGPDAMRSEHRLVIGPWVHDVEGEPDWREPGGRGTTRAEGHLAHMLRWYDHHLRGQDVGFDEEPSVKLFVVNEGWRYFDEWPPKGTVAQDWFLHSDGHANTAHGDGSLSRIEPGSESADQYRYDPADPVMSLSEGQLVAADQAPLADREDVLVYRSAPLSEDLTVVGRPEIRLWLASDRPDTDIFVRLIEESEDRPTINLSQGVVRARYREGFDEEVMLEPGARTEFAIRLMPVGFRFVAGSRIRVDVTSSDFPAFDRNHNTGAPFHTDTELLVASQTVFHDSDHPSVLVLPVLAD